ncbi:hypothetical protein ACVXHA_27725 [Escherichia coli]
MTVSIKRVTRRGKCRGALPSDTLSKGFRMGQSSQPHELGGGLKSRHVTMLSIAGVIGASLFVGSSVAIAEAGPAVLLAYLFAGLLVVMIMRMLAEMAVATPDTGSVFHLCR